MFLHIRRRYQVILFLSLILCFTFLRPNNIFAQKTVNFSLVILPTPEKKIEPKNMVLLPEKTVEAKPISNNNKEDRQSLSALPQETILGIEKTEVYLENISENHTRSELNNEEIPENIRAGPL
jgi:hypothetical protein